MTCIPYTQTLFQKFKRYGSYFGKRNEPGIFAFGKDYSFDEAKELFKWVLLGTLGDNPNPEPSKLD